MEDHNTAWEYCELWLEGTTEHGGGFLGGPKWWSPNCFIRYYTADGAAVRQLAGDQPLPFNPFVKAMALLGAAGWELVTVQPGNNAFNVLVWANKVAYFKRPVVAGRTINEPELVI